MISFDVRAKSVLQQLKTTTSQTRGALTHFCLRKDNWVWCSNRNRIRYIHCWCCCCCMSGYLLIIEFEQNFEDAFCTIESNKNRSTDIESELRARLVSIYLIKFRWISLFWWYCQLQQLNWLRRRLNLYDIKYVWLFFNLV